MTPPARRPLVGVTRSVRRGRLPCRLARWALARAGAATCSIVAGRAAPLDALDGLVIGGGDDVEPARYGGDAALSIRIDPERDALEWDLLDLAERRRLPVLGICRGAQILNVHAGGSLHQSLKSLHPGRRERFLLPMRTVTIAPGSRLASLLGRRTVRVNGLHRQGVDTLGRGLRVCARDEDDVIQALESEAGPFRLAVQWHPELLLVSAPHRRLFDALVEASRGPAGSGR